MKLTFEPVCMEQQEAYRDRLARCGQIASDYSFANLFGWGPEYGLEWAWQEDLVWIRQQRPIMALWAPVGDWAAVDDWTGRLADAADAAERMIRIPETLTTIWRDALPDGLDFKESRGQWDYLYRIEDLVELKGNRFHKKKNLVNQFRKSYAFEYLEFGPQMVDQAVAMQENWCTWRDCESNETLAAENRAIARILNRWRQFNGLTGGAVRVDDTLVAYTLAEQMPDRSVVIHFEKGNPAYKGSYQAINQLFLENFTRDADRVNREQDLDNEGLRKAKMSYHPIDFIKKYELVF